MAKNKSSKPSLRELSTHDHGFISFDDAHPRENEHVLVTNNIESRNAYGRMSHLWLTSFVMKVSDPGQKPEYITFNERDQRIHSLTHWKYAFPLDVIDEVDPNRTDVALAGTQDAATRHIDYRKRGVEMPKYEAGQLYPTQDGEFVMVLTAQHNGIDVLRCSDSYFRYNRPGDMGRVTGSSLYWTHPKNIHLTPITEEYFVEHLQDLIDNCWRINGTPNAKDFLHLRCAGTSFENVLNQVISIDKETCK